MNPVTEAIVIIATVVIGILAVQIARRNDFSRISTFGWGVFAAGSTFALIGWVTHGMPM